MTNHPKLLLIAYKFPPYAGVGGYRWAQLSKYLARLGVEIHVVSVEWMKTSEYCLLSAVQHPNIHIYTIPSGYPHNLALRDFGSRLLNGIRNKVFLHLVNKFYPLDLAQRWGQYLLPFCRELILSHSITSIVATGHPFMANVHAAYLKRDLSHINLIQDMRDLWFADVKTNPMTSPLYEHIKHYEQFALQNADAVVTVTEGFRTSLLETSGSTPVYVIPNGYDPEKFYPSHSPKDQQCLHHFLHLGSVTSGREPCADAFLAWLREHSQYSATFAGFLPKDLLHHHSDLVNSGRLVYLGPVSQTRCLQLLADADVALQFNAEHMQAAASTKIYEYAAAGVPILSFGYGGEAADFISRARCGFSVDLSSFDWKSCLETINLTNMNFNWEYINEFSYKNIAEQYYKILFNDKQRGL